MGSWGAEPGAGHPVGRLCTPPSTSEGDPCGKLGTPELVSREFLLIYSQPSCLKLLLMAAAPASWPKQGGRRRGCRAGDLVALWSPQLAHPLVRPPSHQAPAEGKEGFLQPTSIQKLPTATSRNAFDHLNPGCINSPNPLNSQEFSLMPNGRPFPSFLEHPGATQGPGHG